MRTFEEMEEINMYTVEAVSFKKHVLHEISLLSDVASAVEQQSTLDAEAYEEGKLQIEKLFNEFLIQLNQTKEQLLHAFKQDVQKMLDEYTKSVNAR